MKTKILFIAVLLFATSIYSQSKNNYVVSIDGTKLGFYLSTSGKYSTINSEAAGYLDYKGAVTINEKWAIGFSGTGLYYDKGLGKLVSDGTYHLYISYGALFVERIFTLSDDLKFSVSIQSGYGEAFYQYDKDYRKDKVWSEEIIDRTKFYIFEPGIELDYRVSGNFWIGVTGSYRNTSPLELIGTSETLLQKFNGGLSFKWGIF